MGEIRNQFKSQSLDSLAAKSIQTVGGRVFPDAPSVEDLLAFKAVVESWQGVHLPTYGQPIAGSNAVAEGTGQGTMLQAANDNEVYRIDSIFLNNSGGAPLTAVVRLGTAPINSTMDSMNNQVLQPAGNALIMGPFFMDSITSLGVLVTDGTAADLEWFVKWSKIVQ
jgi:hypothetical protein